ncbi:flagellar filament capping protein FliD [Enterococcus italicus]|uniref:flagellar filament capping protein FliD n=1 Tax=Enterococcus italicus TaxID=246144 RepID=UPI0028AED2A0|nr:flagellar filament capping protein FliD [Enterococcus italicus]
MASITSSSGISTTLGSYSGVTSDDIEKLLTADASKKTLAQNKITTINDQKTAWNDVRTRLSSLLSKVEDLQKAETFATKKVTNSDDSIASITTTADAAENDFSLKVTQLATTTKLIGNKLSDSSKTALGISGSFSLTNSQDKTFTFNVESTDTLKSLTDKINAETKNSAISASIVDNRLVLTSSTTGEHAITVAGESADALGISSTTKASYSLGQQAEFELDGLALKSDSNSVSNVVEGVTFTLKKASTDSTTIKVTTDTDKTVQAVKDLVSQYNSTMSFINDNLSVGDPSSESNTTGKLQGDSTLRSLQERLSSLFTSSAVTGTSLKANDVGISLIDRNGTLGLDEDKLKKALSEDGNAVKNFFYQSDGGKSTITSSSNVSDTNGYTAGLKKLVDGYLVDTTANKGIIATKASTFDLAIKDLNKQITRFDEILTMKRDRYVDMFTRLDQAMMEAETQLSYFTSQTQ